MIKDWGFVYDAFNLNHLVNKLKELGYDVKTLRNGNGKIDYFEVTAFNFHPNNTQA